MKQLGYRTGGRNLSNYTGSGYQLDDSMIAEDIPIAFEDFSGGYNSMVSQRTVNNSESPACINVRVSDKDRLIRAPGTSEIEALAPRAPKQCVVHASLGNRSELVLFDPPFIGYKGSGATTWVAAGIPVGRRYGYANYGGTLIFSNGISRAYVRDPDQTDITELDRATGIIARSYASFAGRIFGGHAIIGGNMEPLGMAWNGTDGDAKDHTGPDSGYEVLIDEMSAADRIIKLVPMGLDFMAILCRKSIWLGRRTGIAARPADFQTRVPGVGCVSMATAHPCELGVLFLSDDGVRLFDGNNAPVVSQKINGDLLPLDQTKLEEYAASYNPFEKLYYLYTPTETWIYDIQFTRWYRSSLIAWDGSVFPSQFARKRWSDLVGAWAAQTGTWADYAPYEGNDISQLFLGLVGADTKIHKEDFDSEMIFETAMTIPSWVFKAQDGKALSDLIAITDLGVEYVGEGDLSVYLPDNDGALTLVSTQSLPIAANPTVIKLPSLHAGKGVGLKVSFDTGKIELIKAEMKVQELGERVEEAPLTPRTLHMDF